MKTLRPRILFWVVLLLFSMPVVASKSREDHLTFEETEQLRDAQEPHLRIKLLDEFLKIRLDRAKALKSPATEKDRAASEKRSGPAAPASETAVKPKAEASDAKTPTKSFLELMEEYLQCLDEISSNVENFSSYKTEPKPYLKSLRGLEESLGKHQTWINELLHKLTKSEKELVSEVSEVLEELSQDVRTAIEKADKELKQLKESKKTKVPAK